MDEEAIAAVVREIEEEKALGRVSGVQVFQSILNQPALLSVSSASATAEGSVDGYTGFSVDMPRPILQVKELELLTANIPLCTQNIPDTACAFWYYRLSLYSGKYPNPNNLFFIRLLPSYYPREFIFEPERFGFNQTFNGYPDLAVQLALASEGDLAQENFTAPFGTNTLPPFYRIQYMKDEAIIRFNTSTNKFFFAGNQGLPLSDRDPQLVYQNWSGATTYAAGDRVKSPTYVQGEGYIVYYALVTNTNRALPVFPREYNTYWSRAYGYEGVADWSVSTAYKTDQYVSYNNTLYQAIQNAYQIVPTNASYWTIFAGAEFPPVYQYLVAGPTDPNVAFMQGTSQRTWSPYALYEAGDNLVYNGITYTATRQNLGNEPFPVPNPTDNLYSATKQYQVGDYVYLAGTPGVYYVNILASKGISPTFGYINNANWNFIEYDTARPTGSVAPASQFYKVGDIVRYISLYPNVAFFKCIKAFPPADSINNAGNALFGENQYWQATFWNTGTSITEVPYVGLAKISADLDMMDDYLGVNHSPYPEGIPPQPFNPVPKRLLNSILGFTWNGKFNPESLSIIYDPVTLTGSTTLSQLLNRVRPLPIYYQGGPPALGSGYDPTSIQDTFVFSANGYAKLVYTSVINIYASIAGGSTIDTIRNTNLIGTMAMNAGNLGIGFSAAYLNATLQTQESDIYSISFSFTDEYGEPYPLTNNAVVTLTFRMGYRS